MSQFEPNRSIRSKVHPLVLKTCCHDIFEVEYLKNGTSRLSDKGMDPLSLRYSPSNNFVTLKSGSHKVTGTNTDRSATYDFLLTFHSNHGPISYRFRENRRLRSNVAKFSLSDGRTDGRTNIGYQQRPRLRIALCGKNAR